MKLPLLISVPHAGMRVAEEVEPFCVLAEGQIEEDSDEWAAEIYAIEDSVRSFVTTDIARAIVDLNRAEDDLRADGVVKTHTCMDVPVYDPFPPADVVARLLERYYRPFHARLSSLVGSDVLLGVDCHTMLAVGPPIGPLAGKERPLICLSDGDGTTCPPRWTRLMSSSLEEAFDFEIAVNYPFKGGFITRSHAAEMPWMQLELSRASFMTSAEKRERVIRALRSFCEKVRP